VILASCDRVIEAPVDVVWRLFTTAEGLNEWMSVEATVDLRPGGTIRWTHENGNVVSGEVRTVVPMRRFEFTYGWETGPFPVEPGSTLVSVEFIVGREVTEVSVRHSGLDREMAARHTEGWAMFVDRLAAAAEAAGATP
jgi:uncharacterized protein YndB with AHSA1/START domain